MLRNLLAFTTISAALAGCGGTTAPAGNQQQQSAAAPSSGAPTTATTPVNYGDAKPAATKPFDTATVATFDQPWALAFLPDRRMLVTEKPGQIWLVTADGTKTKLGGVPKVHDEGQGGLLDVAVSPHFASDHAVYISYSEPGTGGDSLALARATIDPAAAAPALTGLKVIWRQLPRGQGGQFGAYIAFAPDGQHLFLAAGDRQRMTPAQDPDQPVGKILRLTLDGKPAPGNPGEGKVGATTLSLIDPPENTVAAAKAKGRQVTVPAPNLTPAETWSSGHRNPYGLAFDSQGRLWSVEMGPKGGDELNLIEPGRNYGWPLVSYGSNYDDVPIPSPTTRPDLAEPALYWNPVIAPAGLTFYDGTLFPDWRGSAFVGGLAATALVRIAFDGTKAREAERWDMGNRIRAVVSGPDGALWLLEDGAEAKLLRLTPKKAG